MKVGNGDRPDSLAGSTQRLNTGFGRVYVNINEDKHGDPYEVFVTMGNSGGPTNSWTEALGKTISHSFQSGQDPSEIADDLIGIRAGRIDHDNGDDIYSVPDAVGVAIRRHVGGALGESIKEEENE